MIEPEDAATPRRTGLSRGGEIMGYGAMVLLVLAIIYMVAQTLAI